MEFTDFILCAQKVNPQASIAVDIHPEKSSLSVRWYWVDLAGEQREFKGAILLKELNYDEAIMVFFSRCKDAIENSIS